MIRNALSVIAILIGGAALVWLPMADVARGADPLILIFSILAGLLAQMIALTAVIFEPGRMSAESVRKVGAEIDGLQKLNIGLFAIYLAAISFLLALRMISPYDWIASMGWRYLRLGVSVQFIAGALIVLSIIRTFKTLIAVRQLQWVRTQVQVNDAQARENAIAARAVERIQPVADQGGAAYGSFRDLPSTGEKRKRHAGKN